MSTAIHHARGGHLHHSAWRLALAALMCAALLLGLPPIAHAAFGVAAFDGEVVDTAGQPFSQAGGHPESSTLYFDFNIKTNPNVFPPEGWPDEPVKDILIDLPPGFTGFVAGWPKCTMSELTGEIETNNFPLCAPGSQVGRLFVRGNFGFTFPTNPALYVMVPPPGVAVRLGFNLHGTIVTLDATVRSDTDYGVTVSGRNVSEALPITGVTAVLWGVPADPGHDDERSCPGEAPPPFGLTCATEAPRRPFLRLPTSCTNPGQGLVIGLRAASWFHPGQFVGSTFVSHLPPGRLSEPPETDPGAWGPPLGTTGCEQVPFDPTFTVKPKSPARAGAPTGFEFDLFVPQTNEPDGISQADVRKVVVTLPEGVRVSPSSAGGLAACSPGQIALHSMADAACPEASKIGSLRIDTPALDEPLTGAVYLATPMNNPSNSLVGLYLVAKGPGLIIKLAGRVDIDPGSGQITTTFDNNPQTPFSHLHMELKDGPRAPLVNPRACGTYTTHAELTSWSGKTVVSESSYTLSRDGEGAPCPLPQFSPDFLAGVENPVAGKSSSFLLRLTRDDDDEELWSLAVTMPRGLLANIADVPLCDADTAGKAGTCDEASRIGDALTGAGAGANPFYLPGRVYLTDSYNGGPFGLSIVVPAVAGPFDLGTVVVRASIRVDKRTAQLRVISDPLPEVLQGIRLQVRDVRVSVNKDGFMVNPTSCDEKQVGATVRSTMGKTAHVSSRFQVGECAQLTLRPRIRLTVGGKGRTSLGARTRLVAKLTQAPGQSNLRSVRVTLPKTLNARLRVVNNACTQEEYDASDCEKARTGRAVVVTPLLAKPLRGDVFFVKRPEGGLPNLVVALRGQVDFDLIGRVIIPRSNRLSTKFGVVPDVPVTTFILRMFAGSKGAVGVAQNLCTPRGKRAGANVRFGGQNGRVVRASQRLRIRGCKTTRG